MPLNITAMVMYDYVLCLDREYQYVWRSRKSKASRLVYLYIRYISFLDYVMAFATIAPVSDTVSMRISLIHMRLLKVAIVARSCAILADLITIVVTWRATRTSRRVLQDTFKQPSLQDIMWTNGNIYFITLLFGNLLDLILVTLSITGLQGDGNWVIQFLTPMTAILNCRFLLDLYETNARLERGGSSLSQSNIGIGSLHFTGIGAPEAPDSPEDSPFLSSFSGPVLHSFPDDIAALDTADDEPESVPAQTTAPATETAAGGSSSAWRADTTWGSDIAGGSGVAGGSGMAV
ncbi:hypothetical protein C2E23DRAFT_778182 [Lenzites betulinus]|nr:hypothetical protein C2E23DRAFT_778182 [Lenzites betulinus]